MLSSPSIDWLDPRDLDHEAYSAFTHVATRSLAHQPCADFVGRLQHVDYSSCCYPSLAAPGSYRRGISLSKRVTLWITTAIHLDIPKYKTRPQLRVTFTSSRLDF